MTEPYSGQPGFPPQEPPGQPQPGYPAMPGVYPGYGYYPPPQRTNGLAIASLAVSCGSLVTCTLLGCVGAILGHVARRQIRESGEGGDGFALAGIIVGWILFGLSLLGIAAYVVFFVSLGLSGLQP